MLSPFLPISLMSRLVLSLIDHFDMQLERVESDFSSAASNHSIRVVVITFRKTDSSMIGLTFTRSSFFGGFASGVSIPLRISFGYSPVSHVLFKSAEICSYSVSVPYLMRSACTLSQPVALLFFSFFGCLFFYLFCGVWWIHLCWLDWFRSVFR